jgi:hypothetical protein
MYRVTVPDEAAPRVVGLPRSGPCREVGPVFARVAAAFGARGIWPQPRGGVMVASSDPDGTPPGETAELRRRDPGRGCALSSGAG